MTSPESDARRLLMVMQLGMSITNADGHRWIGADGGDDDVMLALNVQLRMKSLEPVRSKCYGSFRDALDAIDEGLKRLGKPSLLEQYKDSDWGLEQDQT